MIETSLPIMTLILQDLLAKICDIFDGLTISPCMYVYIYTEQVLQDTMKPFYKDTLQRVESVFVVAQGYLIARKSSHRFLEK